MESIDFSKLAKFEIIDLIREAKQALEEYDNRDKTIVYCVSIPFIGMKAFIKRHRAIKYLMDISDEDYLFDDQGLKTELNIRFWPEAQLEDCDDWHAEQNPDKYPENY